MGQAGTLVGCSFRNANHPVVIGPRISIRPPGCVTKPHDGVSPPQC